MQKCKKIVLLVILRHGGLYWCQQNHRIFSNFFITFPYLWKTTTNTCDLLGTKRYCLLKFKMLWLQILEIFSAAIFPVLVAKKSFSLENGFSLTKATLYIPKNEEILNWSVYKMSTFAWFLQTVALKLLSLLICKQKLVCINY